MPDQYIVTNLQFQTDASARGMGAVLYQEQIKIFINSLGK